MKTRLFAALLGISALTGWNLHGETVQLQGPIDGGCPQLKPESSCDSLGEVGVTPGNAFKPVQSDPLVKICDFCCTDLCQMTIG